MSKKTTVKDEADEKNAEGEVVGEVTTPRTSGGPEEFAAEMVPSTQSDRDAAIKHAQADAKRGLAGKVSNAKPVMQHSMSRAEMQAAGISDELLLFADSNGYDRVKLLEDPAEVERLKAEFEEKKEAADHGEVE